MDEDFNHRELAHAPVDHAPWYFRLGRYLAKHNIHAGDRLIAEARRFGLLDQVVVYPVGPAGEIQLRVPLWRPANQWDEADVRNFEAAFVRLLSEHICQLPGDVTLVDCGADIGTVSAHVVSRCRNLRRVVALEPNRAAYTVLMENLRALRVQTQAHNAAMGDFSGPGRLVRSPEGARVRDMFLAPHPTGAIQVLQLDDLATTRGTSLVLRIGVAGMESAVITGAGRTIREAGDLIVTFEAHPDVARRRGRDPIEVMHALREQRRNFTFVVDTLPSRVLDPERRIFDQVPPTRAYNVIATSTARAGK